MSLADTTYLLIAVGAVIVVAVLCYYILGEFNSDPALTKIMGESGVSTEHNIDKGLQAIQTLDLGLAFLIFMIGLVTVALATLVQTNPWLFFGSFILLTVTVMLSAVVSNAFVEILSQDQLALAADQFPITMSLLGVYPTICLVLSVLVMIVMYSRPNKALAGF